MKHRILLVEDEADLRTLVEYNLTTAGYQIEAVDSGFAALAALARQPPHLVVLDLMLPDVPGTHVCREIRSNDATRTLPVLMLTAKGEERDRVRGLEIGADDYMVKPVSMRELVLRVGALLRRSAGVEPAPVVQPVAASTGQLMSAGPIRLDLAAHRCEIGGHVVELTQLEFRLLETLLSRAGRVQTREGLLEDVWNIRGAIETRTVDTHVKRLRQKLGEYGDQIETVRGMGYRFRRDV